MTMMNGEKTLPMLNTERIIRFILLAVVLLACVPVFISARYAVFNGDDFSFYFGAMSESAENYFIKSFQNSYTSYMLWQGTYLTNVLNCLLNPLYTYSYSQLRLTLMLLIVSYAVSAYFLSRELVLYLRHSNIIEYIFALIMLPMLTYRCYSEVMLWFVGAMAYLVPMVLLYIASAFLFHALRTHSEVSCVLSCIFMFLMAGGSLMIGTFGACFLLIFLAADWSENGKPDKTLCIVFAVAVIGDLFNCLAPGNFVRHSGIGGFNIFTAIGSAIQITVLELKFLVAKTSFPIFILGAFILGLNATHHVKTFTVFGCFAGILISFVVISFPYALGYNMDGIASADALENRVTFVVDTAEIIGTEAIAALIASWLTSSGILVKTKKLNTVLISVLTILTLASSVSSVRRCIPVQITENLVNGKIHEYASQWKEIYTDMLLRPGEEIVVVEIPTPCIGTADISFGSAPESAHNPLLAKYFGNISVCDAYYIYTHNKLQ